MISHKEKRLLHYSADLMYAIVSDVEKYPEFLPWVVATKVLSRDKNRVIAEMAVGYGALNERYTSNVALDPQAHRIDVTQTRGPFRVLENHWQFTPHPEGCEVEFAIRFAFKSRVLHNLAGAMFKQALLKMTDAFETRAEQIQKGHAA